MTRLIDALRIDNNTKLSLVGSGGKTSALIRINKEWSTPALFVATAHMGKDQVEHFNNHITWTQEKNEIFRMTEKTILTGPGGQEPYMVFGVDPSLWGNIEKIGEVNRVPIFMESDGSKTRPLKAPAEHEPAIPPWANHVVVSVGLSVIGKPLSEQYVHRPQIFSDLTGLEINQPISLQSIVKMLINPRGGLKNIPCQARRTVLLNQLDMLKDKSDLSIIQQQLLDYYDAVITTSLMKENVNDQIESKFNSVLTVSESIAGIILAAGNSRRMGQPKALLDWKGIPFVRACALQAITAGLKPIYIIAGQEYEKIKEIVKDLPVKVILNQDWNEGQSSSVRTAIKSLPQKIGGAVFQLVDQPHISVTLIRKLIYEHSISLAPIILPETNGRRVNPVLFDRDTFEALTSIQGDFGGRLIFSQYPIRTLSWFDESILLDVDTPEDYKHLLELP